MSAIISKDYSHLLPPEHQQHFRLMVTSLPSNMYEGATQHQAYLQTPKGFVAGSRNAVTHPEKRGLIMNYYTSHGAQRPMGGEFNLGDEAHLAPHAAHPMMQAVVERALREHLAGQGADPAAQQLGGNWNDADKLFGRPYSHLGSLQEQLSGVKKLNGGGETTPPVTGHLKVVKAGESDAGEPLEKRSKNVREKTRNVTLAQIHERLGRYANKVGFDLAPVKQTQGGGGAVIYGNRIVPTRNQPATHELGHALMTPNGSTAHDYTGRLVDDGDALKNLKAIESDDGESVDDDAILDAERRQDAANHDEDIASTMEAGIARRAGVAPAKIATPFTPNPHSNAQWASYPDGYDGDPKDHHADLLDDAHRYQNKIDTGQKKFVNGRALPGTSLDAKINARAAMRKNMDDKDKQKLAPPQWLGRPIVDHGHVQDLETRAAMNEFGHKMPRHQAEQVAHDSYVQEQRERAAAHHLAGMKAAMATGNHEDAKKHWALYDMHLKSLGKESIGAVPPEIEKRMMEETGEKPLYRFKAHKGDLYALHEPSKDQAPPQGVPIQKSEAKQCKWKLGERRCKRMVTTDYCHDHVDHWANKIRQREEAETPMEKAALPPAGTGQLASPPAPAAPQLHNTVEGFVGGLKALPKGSPERGKYLTAHMSHAPFISALSQHPQGKQVHAMIMQHLNSPANAGFKPGATKVVAKTETLQTAKELLKAIAELAKGKLLEFPGNPAPAVDQGQPAQVQSIVPPLAECPRCIAAAHNVLQGGAKLEDAIGPQSAAIFRKKHALADPSPYRQGAQNQRIETHRSLTALIHARHDFKKK
jgi:hypothetical protein